MLGPILFIIYADSSTLKGFADDTKLIKAILNMCQMLLKKTITW